jgi:hypothetical protein
VNKKRRSGKAKPAEAPQTLASELSTLATASGIRHVATGADLADCKRELNQATSLCIALVYVDGVTSSHLFSSLRPLDKAALQSIAKTSRAKKKAASLGEDDGLSRDLGQEGAAGQVTEGLPGVSPPHDQDVGAPGEGSLQQGMPDEGSAIALAVLPGFDSHEAMTDAETRAGEVFLLPLASAPKSLALEPRLQSGVNEFIEGLLRTSQGLLCFDMQGKPLVHLRRYLDFPVLAFHFTSTHAHTSPTPCCALSCKANRRFCAGQRLSTCAIYMYNVMWKLCIYFLHYIVCLQCRV